MNAPLDFTARQAMADAALRLAEAGEWKHVLLHELAQEAGRPLADFYPASPADALDCVEEMFDLAVAAPDLAAPDRDSPLKDRLFDLAMRRFEAMEKRRASVRAIEKSMERDPVALGLAHTRTIRTARWLLSLAGEEPGGVVGAAQTQGLALVLAQTRIAWRKDDIGDFAHTLATLDRGLRRGEEWMGRFARTKPAQSS